MWAALVGLWRRRPIPVYLIGGAILAVILLLIVPFGPGVGPLGKAFFALFLWLFASAGIASVASAIELAADAARWVRGLGKGPIAARPLHHVGPLPELSAAKQARVRRAVDMMAEAGVFAPETPDPMIFYAGIAESGAPVRPDAIFEALTEADYYHPGFDRASCMANLVLHETQVEQTATMLAAQIADLARLSNGALEIADVVIDLAKPVGRTIDTRIDMMVNGTAVTLTYPGDVKYLSTMIHHDLAARFATLGTGQRFAWLWVDAGPWISCLTDGAVERLNEAFRLSAKSSCQWAWIDEEPGNGAGAVSAANSAPGA